MLELAQVHRDLGHAPVGPVYSASRRAYPIVTSTSHLEICFAVSKQCNVFQLFTN